MKAIILAAGEGLRLSPLTDDTPKCLLKVGGKPIIDHQISAIKKCGLQDIVVVVGHCQEKLRAHLGGQVTFIENLSYQDTSSMFSLYLTKKEAINGFVYFNSDLIFHPQMLSKLLNSKHPNGIVIDRDYEFKSDMQKVIMVDDRVVHQSRQIDPSLAAGEAIGPVKFSTEGAKLIFELIRERLSKGNIHGWAYDIFSDAGKMCPYYGIDCGELPWWEIDTVEDLEKANEEFKGFNKSDST